MPAPVSANSSQCVQGHWSQRLREHCSVRNLGEPTWQDVSDKRGSRTAWSSIVLIQGAQFYAQFWYAGERLEQAREDAAEVALKRLTGSGRGVEPPPASYYARG